MKRKKKKKEKNKKPHFWFFPNPRINAAF